MFANFTEETCTGTGDTLALAGITTGNIPFSESFANGDLVAYVLEDSAGTIKVAGIGTYVSATDDITRNDTWNWNGTAIDSNPSSNITLSGGTHTVRCDVVARESKGSHLPIRSGYNFQNQRGGANSPTGISGDVLYSVIFTFPNGMSIDAITFVSRTATATAKVRMSVHSIGLDGTVGKLIVETGDIDISTTGSKTETFSAKYLPAGDYITSLISSEDINTLTSGYRSYGPSTLGAHVRDSYCGWYGYFETDVTPGWTSIPAPADFNTLGSANNKAPYIFLRAV